MKKVLSVYRTCRSFYRYRKMFYLIKNNNYSKLQVLNIDKTGLFWKQLSTCTYTTRDEAAVPGIQYQKTD